ncbi:MAG TPA: hypothetical protein VKF62_00560 [Planctomycetota bacterium]|nr:hypothetical protein [Planctomycetota bacterium]
MSCPCEECTLFAGLLLGACEPAGTGNVPLAPPIGPPPAPPPPGGGTGSAGGIASNPEGSPIQFEAFDPILYILDF